jgi:hypothetical protein
MSRPSTSAGVERRDIPGFRNSAGDVPRGLCGRPSGRDGWRAARRSRFMTATRIVVSVDVDEGGMLPPSSSSAGQGTRSRTTDEGTCREAAVRSRE